MVNGVLRNSTRGIRELESFGTTDIHLNEPLHEVINVVNVFSCSDATLLSGQLRLPLSHMVEFIQRSDQHRHVLFVHFVSLRVGLAHSFESIKLHSDLDIDFIVDIDADVLESDLLFFSAFDFVLFTFTDFPDVFFTAFFSRFFKGGLLLEDLCDSGGFNAQFIKILFIFRQDVGIFID